MSNIWNYKKIKISPSRSSYVAERALTLLYSDPVLTSSDRCPAPTCFDQDPSSVLRPRDPTVRKCPRISRHYYYYCCCLQFWAFHPDLYFQLLFATTQDVMLMVQRVIEALCACVISWIVVGKRSKRIKKTHPLR